MLTFITLALNSFLKKGRKFQNNFNGLIEAPSYKTNSTLLFLGDNCSKLLMNFYTNICTSAPLQLKPAFIYHQGRDIVAPFVRRIIKRFPLHAIKSAAFQFNFILFIFLCSIQFNSIYVTSQVPVFLP